MFAKEEYVELFNGAFGQNFNSEDLIHDKPILPQSIKKIDKKRFTHYQPASYLARNPEAVIFSDLTLDRFEKLFAKINGLLK